MKLISLIPLTGILSASIASAQFHPSLQKTASKIDTDGSYLYLSKVDSDLKLIEDYANTLLKAIRDSGEDIPASVDITKAFKIIGLDQLKSSGASAKYDGNVWMNKVFIENGGSNAGIFSVIGGNAETYSVTQFAPAGTDLALQLKLDLRQIETIAKSLADMFDASAEVNAGFSEQVPELNMTFSDLVSRAKVTVNIAIDIDEKKPTQLGPVNIGEPNVIIRLDGAAWLWDHFGPEIIAQIESNITLEKTEADGKIFYRVPADFKENIMDYSPTIVIDKANNHIWIASKEDVLSSAMKGTNNLASSAEFKAAWAGMPEKGNSMAYLSKPFLNELTKKYSEYSSELPAEAESFKPLLEKALADLTKSETGYALSLSQGKEGIHLNAKLPVPLKESTSLLPSLTSFFGYFITSKDSVAHENIIVEEYTTDATEQTFDTAPVEKNPPGPRQQKKNKEKKGKKKKK